MQKSLIQKYNVPGPRYTSYPTIVYWDDDSFSVEKYKETLQRSFNESNQTEGVSVYIHLPFCESLCTFCACHKRITKQHAVEAPYIQTLLKEWKLYVDLLGSNINIKELHLGGGTPTFFNPSHLQYLLDGIFASANVDENAEMSFEGHPNNTTKEHLETLYKLGFKRVSFGVQDYDAKVQHTINRMQPFENVQRVTNDAREIGYNSVSHDLVFGLPFQTWKSVEETIQKTKALKPDRIAFYSYAHVPWVKGVGQRGFDEHDLPVAEVKRQLYENGKNLLEDLGYIEIGMDHFSLPTDSLYQSMINKTIHRNFMGYTSSSTQLMIGLGMSAISDSWYGFAQNDKSVEDYTRRINNNELAIFRGHILNDEDLIIRRHILNIMCLMQTSWEDTSMQFEALPEVLDHLKELENDQLVNIDDNSLVVTEPGRAFVRNIAMAFDVRMMRKLPGTKVFSMTI